MTTTATPNVREFKSFAFKRPLYSLMGDRVMYKGIWSGKIGL